MVALLEAQAGMISRDQLLRSGVSQRSVERMLAGGWLTRYARGVYTREGSPTWLAKAWAGVLLGGDGAVLGGESAAYLHELTRVEPDVITVHTARQLRPAPGYLFVRGLRQSTGEPPRLSYAETVLDLCAEAAEDDLAALLADAISGRRTTEKHLLRELARRSRVPRRALLRVMLGDVASGAHSALERRYLVDVERAHCLPTAIRQTHAHADHRNDCWYEEFGLLVELDGALNHTGSAAFRDRHRDNDHELLALTTLRFGWSDVAGVAACQTARYVADALTSRGWAGPFMTCRHCALVHDV